MDTSSDTSYPAHLAAALAQPVEGDEPLHLFIRQDLEQRIAHSALLPGDLAADQALERLRQPVRQPALLRWLLLALACLLAAAALEAPKLPSVYTGYAKSFPGEKNPGDRCRMALQLPASQIPPPPTVEEAAAQGDPAAYMEAITRDIPLSRPLPADYDATWRKLDPDNAAWLMLQARYLDQPQPTTTEGYTAYGNLGEKLLEEAARLPRYDDYWQQRRRYGLSAWRAPQTWGEATWLSWQAKPFGNTKLPEICRGKYQEVRFKNDFPAMRRLLLARCRVISTLWRDMGRCAPVLSSIHGGSLLEKDRKGPELEFQQELEQLDAFSRRYYARFLSQPTWRTSNATDAAKPLIARYAGLSTLDKGEFAWLKQAALLGLAAATWLGCGLLALRQAPWWKSPAWQCARCLRPLAIPMRRGETARLLFWSLAAPSLWTAGWLSFATGPFLSDFLWPSMAWLALLIALAAAVHSQATLSQALRITGFASSRASIILGRTVLGLAAASLPVLVIYLHASSNPTVPLKPSPLLALAAGLACPGLLWLPLRPLMGLASRDTAVRHALLARRLLRPAAIATILLLLPIPFYHLAERHLAHRAREEMTQPHPCPAILPETEALYQQWHTQE